MGEKYAIFGDIHSNWEALKAVLKDAKAQGATSYVSVGDIVGYNAEPVKCLEKMRELDCVCVRGNHDHYCSHDVALEAFHPLAAKVIEWTRKQLSDEHIAFLKGLKFEHKVGGFTIVHSTLDMPEKWGYVFDSLEADAHFNYQMTAVCFYGHTHLPMAFERHRRVSRATYRKLKISMGTRYFINVGSVGQPRDGDPRAAYAIYDMQLKEIELRRVEYDVGKTREQVLKAGLPEKLAKRLMVGK